MSMEFVLSQEWFVFTLKLFRAFIELENLGTTQPAGEWEDWELYAEVSVPAHNLFLDVSLF